MTRHRRACGKLIAVFLVLTPLGLSLSPKPQRPGLFAPAPGSPFPVGSGPSDIAMADLSGDGKLDVVTANSGSDNLTILLGDGSGGFRPAPGSPLAAGPAPHLVAIGKLNQDAHFDLVVTAHDSNDVRVLLADDQGNFGPAPGSPFPALTGTRPHNHGLALADVNRDGSLDIVTSNCNAGSVSILLGSGRGSFLPAPGSPFQVGRCPYPLAAGDLDGDGALDIVTPNLEGSSLSALLGDGDGGFALAPGSPVRTLARPYFVAIGDLNGDRKLDLAATHDDISQVSLLLGDGRGGFAPAPGSPIDAGQRGGEIVFADVNGDRKLDFVTGTASHSVAVFLGDGRGRFAPAPGSPFPAGRGPWGLALGDINGDGKLDILTANFESNNVSVLLGR